MSLAGDTHALLRELALFHHLDDATLDELAGELEWFALPGGATLFELGDPADSLYVLKSGSLGAFKPDVKGELRSERSESEHAMPVVCGWN